MNNSISPPRYILPLFLTAVLIALLSAVWQTAVTPQVQAEAGQTPPDAANLFAQYELIVVRAYYQDRPALEALAGWNEPWEVNLNDKYAVVEVTAVEYDYLLAAGYELVIEYELTAALNHPADYLPGQIMGIPGYPCYRTVEETYASAAALAADYPHLAEWILIGASWEKVSSNGLGGYDLMVLKLTNNQIPGPKPAVFIMAALHAREYTTAELVTRFGEYLIANYGVDADVTWMLDHHEFHLLLQANPDGRKRAETGLSWRKNTNNNYCSNTNSRGADLNRNFSFAWNICGGSSCSSGNVCNNTYRGPFAASEPETYSIEEYVRSVFPDQRDDPLNAPAPDDATGIFLDIHSYSELVLWPWGFTATPAPNGIALQTLGRKFAYFNGYYPTAAINLYPTDGTTEDFAYGELGLAAYTFELGTAFFQSCSFFESNVMPKNMPALLYAGKVARTPYLTPAGPEALNLNLSENAVAPGEPVTLTAVIDDTRFNASNGLEPAQHIVAAEYYLNVPYWITTTTPIPHPMTAADGSFNQTIETVTAVVDTTDLPPGRNSIFVRGQDAAGNWGPISALFLEIVPAPPTANFTATTPTALGDATAFTNNSLGTDNDYLWDFGDGSAPVTTTHPAHIYAAAGVYTVTLTAVNLLGSDAFSDTVRVMAAPSASFLAPTQATVGATLFFTSTATGDELIYSWDFGDGSPPQAAPHVSHVYTAAGVYTATLSVANPVGFDTAVQAIIIDPIHYLFIPYAGNSGVNPADSRTTAAIRPGATISGLR